MSRIGKLPVALPKGVTATLANNVATIKGPKGELKFPYKAPFVSVAKDGETLSVTRKDDSKMARALHGTTQRLLVSMVTGVSEGFTKALEIQGTGYRAEMKGGKLVMRLGYSHEITFTPPKNITIVAPEPTKLTISGADKQLVGQVAAEIRAFRKPDVYQGKGVRYVGEYVRKKQGKTSK